jgi:serine/threonine-protein kinase
VHQLVREAVITARLQHPHIIPVHELGFLTEGQLYYTMRYVDGNTLDDIAQKVDLEERLRILRNAATAVDHAHDQGLWHRDLKPNNILVGSLGDTYVVDWGLVSVQPGREYRLNLPRLIVERKIFVMPDNLLDETREAVSTITGRIVGTPPYMSPEQIEGWDSAMGAVSDVWALGIMLFEAMTGRHPVENVGSLRPAEIFRQIMRDRLPSPRDISEDVPEVLDSLCKRMLHKSPHERMLTLKVYNEDLTQYLKYQGKTIAGFGTFSQLTKSKPKTASTENLNGKSTEGIKSTRTDNSENTRLQKKVDLLLELAQLNMFSRKRRKWLWRELGRL